jgi:hypothetical protein
MFQPCFTNPNEKGARQFDCKCCDFHTFNKKDFKRHLDTIKHNETIMKIFEINETKSETPKHTYSCVCGTVFNSRTTLWRHSKKCSPKEPRETQDHNILSTMIMNVIKQNHEFQKLLVEQNKQIIELSKANAVVTPASVTNNITNNYSTNKTINNNNKFNLNMFLNEQCKDALNISDFVNSLQISLTDLENMGTLGFVEGISKIFVARLNELDVYKRPIHCSDLKREMMHVKENNVWEKEDVSRNNLISAIKKIADKNIKTIPEWKESNPECRNSESKKSDQYLQIVMESIGPCDKEKDMANYNKIIKRVAKEVIIDKNI